MPGPPDNRKVPHTLLLADDSVTIQRVIELTFADEDVKVVAVSDGDQAIARLDSAPPDIVLADVGMPGKNGYEVAQYIKQSPRLSHIPVVLLTGAFEPVDQARATEAGCDGVLAKPFEPQLVIGRVKELLGQPKGSETAPPPLDTAFALTPGPSAPWTPSLADQPLQSPAAKPVSSDLSNYFDRLDAAFADLSPSPAPAATPPDIAPLANEIAPAPSAGAAESQEVDWFSTPAPAAEPTPAADAWTEPAFAPSASEGQAPAVEVPAFAPSASAGQALVVEAPAFAPSASAGQAPPVAQSAWPAQAPAGVAPSLPDKPVALPPLADAFAALLAAEQGEPPTSVAWPAMAPAPAASTVDDAIVEQIVARVLDQIAPRVDVAVRAALHELVAERAEALIREEIERIKAAIA